MFVFIRNETWELKFPMSGACHSSQHTAYRETSEIKDIVDNLAPFISAAEGASLEELVREMSVLADLTTRRETWTVDGEDDVVVVVDVVEDLVRVGEVEMVVVEEDVAEAREKVGRIATLLGGTKEQSKGKLDHYLRKHNPVAADICDELLRSRIKSSE